MIGFFNFLWGGGGGGGGVQGKLRKKFWVITDA